MTNFLNSQNFNRLLKAAEKAEKSYLAYLYDSFPHLIHNQNQKPDLKTMLRKVFEPSQAGDNTPFFNEKKQLSQELSQQIDQQVYNNLVAHVTKLFVSGDRLERTKDLLAEMYTKSINGTLTQQDKDSMIGKIVGNYKEWSFKAAGEKAVGDKQSTSLFGFELVDVDNKKMDFIIRGVGVDRNTKQQYGRKGKNGNLQTLKFINNGVPLEYKSRLDKFHLTTRTLSTNIVSKHINHHFDQGIVSRTNQTEDVIIDLTMLVIIDKINEGFPVFVTSNAGTHGRSFLLCSELLQSIANTEDLKSKVINQSTYTPDLLAHYTVNQILTVVQQDKKIRAQIEQDIIKIRDNADLSKEEMEAQLEEAETRKIAASILQSLTGRRTLMANLTYAKK